MNILVLEFITTVGGVQTVYKNILPYLAKEHNVYFLDPYNNKFQENLTEVSNINVINLPINSKPNLGWGGSFLNKITVLFKYGLTYFVYLIKLLKLIKHKKINLIYVSGKKELVFAYLVYKLLNVKYIYHGHGFKSYEDISFVSRIFINSAAKILAVSINVKEVLQKAKIKKEKIEVVYNGINLNASKKQSKNLNLITQEKNNFKIIMVGSIQPKKGIHILINAVNILLNQGLKITLDIVGDITSDDNKNYIDELITLSKKINDNAISFLGYKKNVYKYINDADILVLPSLEESFGMVLIEAMYLSKPIIGSKIGGIPEVIADGENGYLFDPENEEELSEKINLLRLNKSLRKKMGRTGKDLVVKKFNAKFQAKNILNIIQDIN